MTDRKKEEKKTEKETALTEANEKDSAKKESDSTPKTVKKARPVARTGSRTKKEAAPLPPSPKQSILDNYVQKIMKKVGKQAVTKSYINRAGEHLPTLVILVEEWFAVAEFLRKSLHFVYIQNYAAIDHQSHMEVVLHLHSFIRKERVAIRVKLDHEKPILASLTPLYPAANWNEREMYDLLGIRFTGHPNLTRILMPDDWEGHPLRKDYKPLDQGV